MELTKELLHSIQIFLNNDKFIKKNIDIYVVNHSEFHYTYKKENKFKKTDEIDSTKESLHSIQIFLNNDKFIRRILKLI